MGENGAGHYVKMVHNGIEYGDMQLICEAYQLMQDGLGMSADEMHEVFAEWNKGELDSYLIEITRDILAYKDADGKPLVDKILDTAGQKGTGKWTGIAALDMGIPLTLIGEAVFARALSALKDERVAASKVLTGPDVQVRRRQGRRSSTTCEEALYASKIISYAQGYMLMRAAAKEYKWNLNYGGIALMWRGGCIIRSRVPGQDQGGLRQEPGAHQPAARSLLQARRSARRRRRGGAWWPRPSRRGSRFRPCPAPWPSSTATAASGCPPTCSRRSATTSARTPTSAWTSRAASSSTPTGPGTAAT